MRKIWAEICDITKSFGLRGMIKLLFVKYKMKVDEGGALYCIPIKNKCRQIFIRNGTSDWDLLGSFYWDPNERMYDINFNEYLNPREVTTVIDAGANIGLFTIRMTEKFPNASFICIEPEESNYDILRKNLKNIDACLYNNGLWKKETKLEVTTTELSEGTVGYIVKESKKDNSIDGISIDAILKKEKIETIDILKMDIEGSEFPIFFSGSYKSWINKVKMIIIEMHDAYCVGGGAQVTKLLEQEGFIASRYGEDILFIRNNLGRI